MKYNISDKHKNRISLKEYSSLMPTCACVVVAVLMLLQFLLLHDVSGRAQKLMLVGIFAAYILALVYFWRLRKEKRSYNADLETRLADAENYMNQMLVERQKEQLNALQSQINPHFLYNTLDTIRGLAIESGSLDLDNMVSSLSSMFKYSMDYSDSMVSLNDELLYLKQYLYIQEIRFPGRYQFEQIDSFDKSDVYTIQLPKFVIQPLVENALSHGLKNTPNGGKITLRFVKLENVLNITVSDNGVGMTEDMVIAMNRFFESNSVSGSNTSPRGPGLALTNIDSRIKISYGRNYGLHITSTPDLGTEVLLRIPITRVAT